jgi:hypothetical protein
MKAPSRLGRLLSALLLAAALQGCGVQVNLLRSIELVTGQNKAVGTPIGFVVTGSGTCEHIGIDWGDGSTMDLDTARNTSSWSCHVDTDASGAKSFRCYVEHTFGWEGGKTVTATATRGCVGPDGRTGSRVNTRFLTSPAIFLLGFRRPGPNACDAVPNKPALAERTNVSITTVPIVARCPGIYYQNVTPHCYDAEGVDDTTPVTMTSTGTTPFPFPNMRRFSMVLRVGTQVVQGSTNTVFTTNQSAPLEVCVNEPDPTAGGGGYEIDIRTDEMGPPP